MKLAYSEFEMLTNLIKHRLRWAKDKGIESEIDTCRRCLEKVRGAYRNRLSQKQLAEITRKAYGG